MKSLISIDKIAKADHDFGLLLVTSPLLDVVNLSISFETDEGALEAIDNISFSIQAGETVGLVGESGCGKSVTAHSIMRLLPQPMGRLSRGSIKFNGTDLRTLTLANMESIRGSDIGMIFQEPMTALNPVQTIGKQISESLTLHLNLSIPKALQASIEMLEHVGVPSPELTVSEYPHQLSGGMLQRVVIAIALACKPSLLIADEPTTALDVTIQAQILGLISDLQDEMKMAVLLITHDLGIIAETCDRVLVMYAGRIVESGTVTDIFDSPAHPYTQGLLNSIPRLATPSKSRLPVISGQVPSIQDYPAACRFENRCSHRLAKCAKSAPEFELISDSHQVSCFAWQNIQRDRKN
ncbi:MAG: peptide/nickel transport system ATP-binding protein [Rubritalea sp.]